jgi:hypothetical protein
MDAGNLIKDQFDFPAYVRDALGFIHSQNVFPRQKAAVICSTPFIQ